MCVDNIGGVVGDVWVFYCSGIFVYVSVEGVDVIIEVDIGKFCYVFDD